MKALTLSGWDEIIPLLLRHEKIGQDMITVTRTEQIHIPYDSNISNMCHTAKNLYNQSNYIIRQEFFTNHRYIKHNELKKQMKTLDNFKRLYRSTSQGVLQVLDRSWKSYFEAIKSYKLNPSKFTGKPRIPGYKKKDGEFILIFTNQACHINNYTNFAKGIGDGEGENNKFLKIIKQKYGKIAEGENYLMFPTKYTGISPIKTRLTVSTDLREVRIVPQGGNKQGYNVEIVYDKEVTKLNLDKSRICAIDYGLSNIVAIANNIGEQSIVIKGSVLKSINQWYNKRRAELYSIYDRQPIACNVKTKQLIYNRYGSKLQTTTTHRNRIVKDIMHKISRFIINWCVQHNVGTLLIGHNDFWKQRINIGKVNNQNFVTIPYYILTKQLTYKGQEVGIDVLTPNEAHTSKCSFLDSEPVCHHEEYVGKRIKRGLFKSAKGIIVNADVHSGANLIRKVFPNVSWKIDADGIVGTLTCPVRISIKDLLNKSMIISHKPTNNIGKESLTL